MMGNELEELLREAAEVLAAAASFINDNYEAVGYATQPVVGRKADEMAEKILRRLADKLERVETRRKADEMVEKILRRLGPKT